MIDLHVYNCSFRTNLCLVLNWCKKSILIWREENQRTNTDEWLTALQTELICSQSKQTVSENCDCLFASAVNLVSVYQKSRVCFPRSLLPVPFGLFMMNFSFVHISSFLLSVFPHDPPPPPNQWASSQRMRTPKRLVYLFADRASWGGLLTPTGSPAGWEEAWRFMGWDMWECGWRCVWTAWSSCSRRGDTGKRIEILTTNML